MGPPRRGERLRCDTPPPPAVQVVQPDNFSFIKKTRLREAPVSQNRSRRRGPHRASSPGHVPRLRGTGTELRGRQRVRSPRAAPAGSGADRPASGEAGRTPEGDLGLDSVGDAGVSLVCSGTGTGTPSSVRATEDPARSALSRNRCPPWPGGQAQREERRSTSPPSRPPASP